MRVTRLFAQWAAASIALVIAFTASMITRPAYDGAFLLSLVAWAIWMLAGIRFQRAIRLPKPQPFADVPVTPYLEQLDRDVAVLAANTRIPTIRESSNS